MNSSEEAKTIATGLVQAIAYLDVFGAKMIDDGSKEQAVFCAKVIKIVHEALKFIITNTGIDLNGNNKN